MLFHKKDIEFLTRPITYESGNKFQILSKNEHDCHYCVNRMFRIEADVDIGKIYVT